MTDRTPTKTKLTIADGMTHTAIWLKRDHLPRLDALAVRMTLDLGVDVSRSDLIRKFVEDGLRLAEKEKR